MFGDNNNNKKNEKAKGKVETILGNGTKIEGDLHTNGSLRVEGKIIGNIKAEGDLFVGEAGEVKNEVEARNVIIAGKVDGNVYAHKKLEILASGCLSGDLKSKTLKIEEGATFNGSSKTLDGKDSKKKGRKTRTTNNKKDENKPQKEAKKS